MPVEILELIVRANVQEESSISPLSTTSEGHEDNGNIQRQALIEECVEQVLEILRRREER